MMKSNISRLAVLGLAAISSPVFAAVSLSGQVRLDTKFVSEPATKDDSMSLSRARLNLKGDVSSDWVAGARLEGSDSLGVVKLERAFASWSGLENHTVTLGKTGHISTDADDNYYAPYTEWSGVLDGFTKSGLGFSLSGSMGAIGYSLGLVNVDLNEGDDESLNFSMGSRVHFTAMNSDAMAWGVGAGLVSDKQAESTVIVTGSGDAKTDKFSGMTLDVSGVMGKIALTSALYTAKQKAKTAVADGNPFTKDGKANSHYVEVAYLVMGDGYGFGSGVVSGPKFKSSALELGARLGHKTVKNLAAVSSGTVSAFETPNATTNEYKMATNSSNLFANYHVNSNAVVKVEYHNSKTKDKSTGRTAAADLKAKHLSVRAQFSF